MGMRTAIALALTAVVGCGGEVSDDLSALEARVDALESENAALRANLDAAMANIDTLEADMDTVESDIGALAADVGGLDEEVVRKIDTLTVLSVPGDHATIQDALDWLDDYRIANAIVRIEVADGTYSSTQSIIFRHPDGKNIYIVGNTETPGNVVLEYTGPSPAVFATDGSFGRLDGVTVRGSEDASCISAGSGAWVQLGSSVVVENCATGVSATSRGTVWARETISRNNTSKGYAAGSGGWIFAPLAWADSNSVYGFFATDPNSFIDAGFAESTGNDVGYDAVSGAIIEAGASTASGNTSDDYAPDPVTEIPAMIRKP